MIHDFDIGHTRFSYDTYDGTACGPGILVQMSSPPDRYFIIDPGAAWPLPCQQLGRRAGVAVLAVGVASGSLEHSPWLAARAVPASQPVPA
jgi:hypothetical protein